MDLQQEQLARSLGVGHRAIHGVAGSGKTMILGYRAEYLAKAAAGADADKPVLVLCYNQPLGGQAAGRDAGKATGRARAVCGTSASGAVTSWWPSASRCRPMACPWVRSWNRW